jgi:predicted exporter
VKRSPLAATGIAVVLFGPMALFVATHLEIQTGLGQLLSGSRDQKLADVSGNIVNSPITRGMVLALHAPDRDAAVLAASRWAPRIAGHPEVASVRRGPDAELEAAVFDLYFQRRLAFLSTNPEVELPVRLSPAGLDRAADDLLSALQLPQGQLIKRIAGEDPLLAFPSLVRRFRESRSRGLDIVDGQFLAGNTAILFVTTASSPFDTPRQAPLDDFLAESFAALNREFGGGLRLERSGVHRFAVASERHARSDMRRIGAISIIGIVGLFLVAFRSLWLLAIALVPLAGGILFAATAGILLFGPLHVMTLAFGSTLIGVCIDYPIHYISHHALADNLEGSRYRLRGAVSIGALTTMTGFAGFAWSEFPGVSEIGVFAATGVLGALATTVGLLPSMLPAAGAPSDLLQRVSSALAGVLERMAAHRRLLVGLLGVAVAVSAIGIPRAEIQDDVFALGLPPNAEWQAEDARVRSAVSGLNVGSFVVAFGRNNEQALQVSEQVAIRLEEMRNAGELDEFSSIRSFLFSESLQRRNLAALGDRTSLVDATLEALEKQGFRRSSFDAFTRSMTATDPTPLTYDELARSPLAPLVAGFRVELPDEVAILTFLRGAPKPEQLHARLKDLQGAHYFEQREFLHGVYRQYRSRTVTLIGLGLLAVVAVLQLRYRDLRTSAAIAVPALLAASTTMGLLSLFGIPISLLHLLGLLLVLSIGVDYAVFLVTSAPYREERNATLVGLSIACLSTCLSFGLLGWSAFPALHALGVATAIGVPLSFLLAPIVLVLADPQKSARRDSQCG